MHYVYVLQSEMNKGIVYIGNTNDLQRRLTEHNHGNNYSTRKINLLDMYITKLI